MFALFCHIFTTFISFRLRDKKELDLKRLICTVKLWETFSFALIPASISQRDCTRAHTGAVVHVGA